MALNKTERFSTILHRSLPLACYFQYFIIKRDIKIYRKTIVVQQRRMEEEESVNLRSNVQRRRRMERNSLN